MKTSCLEEYGIPRVLIDAWIDKQGADLLPLQERAVRDYDLLDGGSLILSAPTSSGKTFCGELAAARALAQRRKVVFLVPLKALAEERFAEFEEKYKPLGIRTVISTRDRHEFDRQVEMGEFDLGVIIYEKFNQMLLRNLDLLKSIDLLVIDELQMLADESRGASLEILILKVLKSSYECRIIGLSAVLSNARQLADWIGARLLIESHRPVELRQGVLFNDTFSFRCFNSGEKGTEQMAPLQDTSPAEILVENVAKLADDGEQVLVFLKSKSSCVQLATLLAERASFTSSDSAINELASGEETLLSEPLMNAVRCGIAFHNADLSYRERKTVEKYYLSGNIRVIFATTTLSLGLNLPAQTAFLETYRYRQGTYTGQPVIETLSWNDYENMCGRAGRLRFPAEFGRSIVIASSELESEMLWKSFIRGRPDTLTGRLFSRNLPDLMLDLIVSRCSVDSGSLSSVLGNAFTEMLEETAVRIDDVLLWLSENELISESSGELMPTA
ncbi:MAG: DEAD/DEAH box helicase, partial [candidate division Zixibacteria bacterium]|nr:DEAD/DEAH box helicase [candidate division Zixibacteria bacterium]